MNTDPKAPTQISQEEEEVEAAGEVAASDLFEVRAIQQVGDWYQSGCL
jgi:hypothetical protein